MYLFDRDFINHGVISSGEADDMARFNDQLNSVMFNKVLNRNGYAASSPGVCIDESEA